MTVVLESKFKISVLQAQPNFNLIYNNSVGTTSSGGFWPLNSGVKISENGPISCSGLNLLHLYLNQVVFNMFFLNIFLI